MRPPSHQGSYHTRLPAGSGRHGITMVRQDALHRKRPTFCDRADRLRSVDVWTSDKGAANATVTSFGDLSTYNTIGCPAFRPCRTYYRGRDNYQWPRRAALLYWPPDILRQAAVANPGIKSAANQNGGWAPPRPGGFSSDAHASLIHLVEPGADPTDARSTRCIIVPLQPLPAC